jgi:hypothetical protein
VSALWAVSLIVALGLLPVGLLRMVAYRSGEVDHTPPLRFVARLALGVGAAALLVFVATTAWYLATGTRPF